MKMTGSCRVFLAIMAGCAFFQLRAESLAEKNVRITTDLEKYHAQKIQIKQHRYPVKNKDVKYLTDDQRRKYFEKKGRGNLLAHPVCWSFEPFRGIGFTPGQFSLDSVTYHIVDCTVVDSCVFGNTKKIELPDEFFPLVDLERKEEVAQKVFGSLMNMHVHCLLVGKCSDLQLHNFFTHTIYPRLDLKRQNLKKQRTAFSQTGNAHSKSRNAASSSTQQARIKKQVIRELVSRRFTEEEIAQKYQISPEEVLEIQQEFLHEY